MASKRKPRKKPRKIIRKTKTKTKTKTRTRTKIRAKTKTAAPERVLDAMNQIWLAGLGAMAKARQGAPQMLSELAAEGARIQANTRGSAEKALGGLLSDVKATIDSGMSQVRGQAGDALENLETIFQTRGRRALTQLGVPSSDDVVSLSRRVDQLTASITKLGGKSAGPRRSLAARKSSNSVHAAAA
jgi:poly(hydroxyalkanoate) granule-associated protein